MTRKFPKQPTNFYIRLNPNLPSEKPHIKNSVSNFENKLNHTIHLEDYKIAMLDICLKGDLDSLTLNSPEDYKFSIYEIIPAYDQLDLLKSSKFHDDDIISETLDRYLDISENWQDVTTAGYTTTVLTSILNREDEVTVRTDLTLRTDLTSEFLPAVDKIASKTPAPGITIAKAEMELMDELQFFEQEGENVSFTYNNIKRTMNEKDFSDLIALRVRELKKKKSNKKKQELLERELDKYPETQRERKPTAMTLSMFLNHIRATLNIHPLY